MQQDAKWAVVGIGIYRMHVRNLRNRQQCQQDEAHHGHRRQSEQLCTAFPSGLCAKSCQSTTPSSRIHNVRCGRDKWDYASRIKLDTATAQT
jgi:hypothetical protein